MMKYEVRLADRTEVMCVLDVPVLDPDWEETLLKGLRANGLLPDRVEVGAALDIDWDGMRTCRVYAGDTLLYVLTAKEWRERTG